jgi:hypothetical protein
MSSDSEFRRVKEDGASERVSGAVQVGAAVGDSAFADLSVQNVNNVCGA